MNDRRDFFTGAGFDEVNGNNQPMNNGMMNNNQGMMNQQPMQQMPNNNTFGGMQAQPMMDNSQMMNQQPMNNGMMDNNQGMMYQQSMNNGMMMQQPNPSFGNGAPLNGKVKSDNGIIRVIGTIAILAIVVSLLFVFGHKTLSCSHTEDFEVFSSEVTVEMEYWFGKATSMKMIMKFDVKDLDDDVKDKVMEIAKGLEKQTKEEASVKTSIEESDEAITFTAKKKINNDKEVDSYDKEKKGLEDEEYVCK